MVVIGLNGSKMTAYNLPLITKWLLIKIQGYNHSKYWERRKEVVNPVSQLSFWIKLYYLYYIKKVDAKHQCTFGTSYNSGAYFASPPSLPHGPNGIIVGHDAVIGKKCKIFHQVTIAHGGVRIGDNVTIGAGAKILPHVHIGNYCKIGANAVVIEDMPDYSTCVMQKPRIIIKK